MFENTDNEKKIFVKQHGSGAKLRALKTLQEEYSKITDHPFSNFSENKIVFGDGNVDSPIVFLGEGPGRDEDEQGRPFVGRAGRVLTQLIESMGLLRKDVFITNVIKCRLPNNRPPTAEEIIMEKDFILDSELKILQPKIICCLGASATRALLGSSTQISAVRGKILKYSDKILVVPTYHPAYLLRNPLATKVVLKDLQLILSLLD